MDESGRKAKNIGWFIAATLLLAVVAWFVLRFGKGLEHDLSDVNAAAQDGSAVSLHHPLAVFIMQLILIIFTSRVFGFIFKKIGQPAVMGEIIAGIVLGPSLMGALFPSFTEFVFPAASIGNLKMLSQVGLILFMFVIGMELDLEILKNKLGAAVLISHFSVVIPFALGMMLSYYLYLEFAFPGVHFVAFSLFMGIAMSITAFPVLARVLKERGLTTTRLGITSITSAAVGDITAWCLLAIIIAVARAGSVQASLYTILYTLIYVLVMFLVIKPLIQKITTARSRDLLIRQSMLAVIFLILLGSSYVCEIIGIHALFGAFMVGVIMPAEWSFRKQLTDKIEDVALVLLLPLFFVITGLQTYIGAINDLRLWGIAGIIILVAIIGKFGGSAIAAKLSGESTKDSLSIGALMNTRGLMELVVLNIGLELHILTPVIFTMLVVMAIATTLLTSPLLNLIDRIKK